MEIVDKNLEGKYIIIVEDDVFLGDLLQQKLIKEKCLVFLAKDGETGVEKIQEKKPDLVLLDILLPGIDGYEVLRKIKADPKLADIPVIIFSNFGQRTDIEKAEQLGAIDFIVKATSSLDDIVSRVKSVLLDKILKP